MDQAATKVKIPITDSKYRDSQPSVKFWSTLYSHIVNLFTKGRYLVGVNLSKIGGGSLLLGVLPEWDPLGNRYSCSFSMFLMITGRVWLPSTKYYNSCDCVKEGKTENELYRHGNLLYFFRPRIYNQNF